MPRSGPSQPASSTTRDLQQQIDELRSRVDSQHREFQVQRQSNDSEARSLRSELQSAQSELQSAKSDLQNLRKDVDPLIRGMAVPMIVAIVYKTMYRELLMRIEGTTHTDSTLGHSIRNLKDRYRDVGLPNQNAMRTWATSYDATIKRRNIAAHTTSGDEIVRYHSRMPLRERRIVGYAFPKLFFGIEIKDWSRLATAEQKQKRISNCSDEDMEGLVRRADQLAIMQRGG